MQLQSIIDDQEMILLSFISYYYHYYCVLSVIMTNFGDGTTYLSVLFETGVLEVG